MPQVKPDIETFAKIKVVGVGGSGGSAVDRMVKSGIRGVEFMAMNTDIQALHHNSAGFKLHLGKTVTRGLGAGMDPEVGKRAAEEAQNEIREALKDTDMVFITCGLGGGTGSGASPVIAEVARDMGALTVGVVTKPFSFEGPQRKKVADEAFYELASKVDTIITIPNDRVLQIIDKKTSFIDAFRIVDDVLRQGVQGISEIITMHGVINVDFADVKTIMKDQGSALMGIGIGSGESRAIEAAKAAISSPLLELSIEGAKGILLTVTGSSNLGMQEAVEAAQIVTNSADSNVKVIFGAVLDESMGDEVRVMVIATGFEDKNRKNNPHGILELKSPLKTKSFYSSSIFRKNKFFEPREEENNEEDFNNDFNASAEKEEPQDIFNNNQIRQEKSAEEISTPPMSVSPQPQQKNNDFGFPSKEKMSISKLQEKIKEINKDEDLEIPAFIRKKMGM